MLKPGAEKLALFFGLEQELSLEEKIEDWGDGTGSEPLFYYRYRVTLSRSGRVMGLCDGSCTSREVKYRYRKGGLECPACGEEALIKSKYNANEYYCLPGKDGCGAKFPTNDPGITDQVVDRTLNPERADSINTYIKMAIKRALIGAVLIATGGSAIRGDELWNSSWKVCAATAVMSTVCFASSHLLVHELGRRQLTYLLDVLSSIPLGLGVFYGTARRLRIAELDGVRRAIAGPLTRLLRVIWK